MLTPLVLFFALHAEPNEAEQAFRKMEMKLTKAKSLECTFEAKFGEGDNATTLKGDVALDEGDKTRLEMTMETGGMKVKSLVISDGNKEMDVSEKSKTTRDASKGKNDTFREWFTQVGVMPPLVFFGVAETKVGEQPKEEKKQPKEWKFGDLYKVSNFQLGKKEQVGSQEVQVIQYTITAKVRARERGLPCGGQRQRVARHENESAAEARHYLE